MKFTKGQTAWNKGMKHAYKPRPNMRGRTPWNKGIKTGVNMSVILKGRHLSPTTEFKKGEERITGYNNPNWKGDDVGYVTLHRWVTRHLGSPSKCSNCGTTQDRMYHWANISGNYLRDLSDWVRLCVPCHHKRDEIHKKIWESRRLNQ